MKNILIIMAALIISNGLKAENKPVAHQNDNRIKVISYKENDIIPIYGSYKHITHIDLGEGNTIEDVLIGDSESWLMAQTNAGDGVFIKPTQDDAKTNLTLITAKRKYYFDVKRSEYNSTYSVKFKYPVEEFTKMTKQLDIDKQKTVQTDLNVASVAPENWNFSYILEGDKTTSPINMFDDGVFTYLEFGKKDIPAFFSVDRDKNEAVVNFHKSGRYVVLEGVFKQLTMRNGVYSTCIYNKEYEAQILDIPSIEFNANNTGEQSE